MIYTMNDLMILYSETNVGRKVDLEKLVNVYSSQKERRKITLK